MASRKRPPYEDWKEQGTLRDKEVRANILADKERTKRQKSILDTKPGRLSSVLSLLLSDKEM